MRRLPLTFQAAVLPLLCALPVLIASAARPETPASKAGTPASKVHNARQAKPGADTVADGEQNTGTIVAMHAAQQHHRLGAGDMYVGGTSVKWIFNGGDLVCLFRALEKKVLIYLPTNKAVFEETFDEFRKRGITFTQGGQERCSRLILKEIPKKSEFQKFPVRVFTLNSPAVSNRGEKRLINIGTLTTLAEPAKLFDMADFISLAYGLPKRDSVILDMTMKFHVEDGSLWFKTSERDLPCQRQGTNDSWLKTIKLENVTVPANFFDAPKNYRKVESQEKIMGMAPAAKDFEDLMFAEPQSKK